jgi:hypothetical protein
MLRSSDILVQRFAGSNPFTSSHVAILWKFGLQHFWIFQVQGAYRKLQTFFDLSWLSLHHRSVGSTTAVEN